MRFNFAETRIPIVLGGKEYRLIFNVNSMCAYEEKTGKFFLNTVSDLLSAVYPNGTDQPPARNPLVIISKVSMIDLRALLWAAIHEYSEDDSGEPYWPMTVNQVGRMLTIQDILPVFQAFLTGQAANNPTKAEMGESQAETGTEAAKLPNGSPPNIQEPGGERGIELPQDAFA